MARSPRPRVFVTQPVAKSAIARLRQVATVKINPDASGILPRRAMLTSIRQCDVLFCLLHDRIDAGLVAANPTLRMIASMAINPVHVDIEAATARGIPVTNVPPLTADTTADLALGLMLAVTRRIVEGDRLVRRGKFPGAQSSYLLGPLVWGKTIGLIGGGGMIGKAVARRAAGFNMRVLYWAPRRKSEQEEREAGLIYTPFETLLRESDFVSLHTPLNSGTRHQIGAKEIKLMKKTAYLINTARGAIVDETALTRALAKKRIAGAGLDVFEYEPKVGKDLRKLNNVVLTPHLGSAVGDMREQMAHFVVDNILAFLAGENPPNCVNPQVLPVK